MANPERRAQGLRSIVWVLHDGMTGFQSCNAPGHHPVSGIANVALL